MTIKYQHVLRKSKGFYLFHFYLILETKIPSSILNWHITYNKHSDNKVEVSTQNQTPVS